jgi:hypothetical protein
MIRNLLSLSLLSLLLTACAARDDFFSTGEYKEYIHVLMPLDNQDSIISISYPKANKSFSYTSAGSKRLLISAYKNTELTIVTAKNTFELLIIPETYNSYNYTNKTAYVNYTGYKIGSHNFNEYTKTSLVGGQLPNSSSHFYNTDTLFFK